MFKKDDIVIRFFMKSGNSFNIRCCEFGRSSVGITWKNDQERDKLIHVNFEDIEAIVRIE